MAFLKHWIELDALLLPRSKAEKLLAKQKSLEELLQEYKDKAAVAAENGASSAPEI